jgi:hypothetical protein
MSATNLSAPGSSKLAALRLWDSGNQIRLGGEGRSTFRAKAPMGFIPARTDTDKIIGVAFDETHRGFRQDQGNSATTSGGSLTISTVADPREHRISVELVTDGTTCASAG